MSPIKNLTDTTLNLPYANRKESKKDLHTQVHSCFYKLSVRLKGDSGPHLKGGLGELMPWFGADAYKNYLAVDVK